ncbi:substrate-binding periplasmic protein [Spartinivicinus ruber]|uniref:substrate-binding periplasmic protein n=1 Tax=Spartinivicinus ruber TaxID=2683272 RepID=UPI0013D5980E|nr:transporter substrate-binding domain-containing protein [Spartinivicinus ruber]
MAEFCEKPLTISFDNRAEPWSYLNQAGQLTGLDVELITAIFNHTGCRLNIRLNIPWQRQVFWVKQGKLDIAAQASKTKKREAFAYFSQPYRQEYIAIYIRAQDQNKFNFTKITELPDLKFRLGIRRGNYYGEAFNQLAQNSLYQQYIQKAETEQDNFLKLIANRIDGFIGYPPGTEIDLKKAKVAAQIIRHPMPAVDTGDIHVMFSKKAFDQTIVTRFNQSLQAIKTSGEYNKIVNKYNGNSINSEH